MKKIILLILIVSKIFLAQSQEPKDSERLHAKISLQNNHLWRGLIITDKPVVFGQLWYDLNASRTLQLGIWGASSLSNDSDGTHYKEINYYIQYANNGFSIGLWDLFNSRNISTPLASDKIFDYNKNNTSHIIDLRTAYQFQPTFPLRIELDVMLYGGANANEIFRDSEGKYDRNRYSSYLELSYPLIGNAQGINLNAFAGAGFAFNPGNPDIGQTTFLYGNGKNKFDVVNIGLSARKEFGILETKIPVHLTTMWNPSSQFARIQVGTSFQF